MKQTRVAQISPIEDWNQIMKHANAFVRMVLIVLSVALGWFELIPAMRQVAEKLIPGFDYSREFWFSLYGFPTVLIFGIALIGGLVFFFQMALRLADWICVTEETQT